MTSILKADTIQDAAGNNIINENANTITIGASGDTINVPSGATFNINGTAGTGVGVAGITSSADATAITIDSSENVSMAQLLKFNSGYGSAATAYGVRAWVKFNGTGTISITGSGNVASLGDNGTGDYAINFTTALVDANYAHFANSVKGGGAPTGSNSGVGFGIENRTVNGFGVAVGDLDGTIIDRSEVFGCVIR